MYKLADADGTAALPTALAPPKPAEPSEDERKRKLEDLRFALWAYAATHGGKLPADAGDAAITEEKWRTLHASRMRYVYVPGRTVGTAGREVIAFEPAIFSQDRFALIADGTVGKAGADELEQAVPKPKQP